MKIKRTTENYLKLVCGFIVFFTISLLSFTTIFAQQNQSQLVPGQLIIKLKASETNKSSLNSVSNTPSLSDLHAKYRVKTKTIKKILPEQSTLRSSRLQASVEEQNRQRIKDELGLEHVIRVEFEKDQDGNYPDVFEAIRDYESLDEVEYAEPNYLYKMLDLPNDEYFFDPTDSEFKARGAWGQEYPDLWGLYQINAPQAWETTEGEGVVVAVVDTGIMHTHPDLVNNMWINEGEDINNNGMIDGVNHCPEVKEDSGDFNCIDDDGNSYIDDVYGYDFSDGDSDPDDYHGHGTHCAGTIAAEGYNEIGVIGVAPKAKLMAVKIFPNAYTDNIANAIVYAVDQGADVLSNSWGGGLYSKLLEDVFTYAHRAKEGTVVSVAAAGNSNVDAQLHFPSAYARVISVGANTQSGKRASFSNFGFTNDVMAPGGGDIVEDDEQALRNILSTVSDGIMLEDREELIVSPGYGRIAGTSMATPHVSGLVALLKANNPELSNEKIRQSLRRSTQIIDNVTGDSLPQEGWHSSDLAFGIIDATAALEVESSCAAKITRPLSGLNAINGDDGISTHIEGIIQCDDFSSYQISIIKGNELNGQEWEELYSSLALPQYEDNQDTAELAVIDLQDIAIGIYTIRLRVKNTQGQVFDDYIQVHRVLDFSEGQWPVHTDEMLGVSGELVEINYSAPIITDINGSGCQEIIMHSNKAVYIFDHYGELLQKIEVPGEIDSIAVGELDLEYPGQEIFVVNRSNNVRMFHADGSLNDDHWPQSYLGRVTDSAFGEQNGPVIADVDQDGQNEMILASSDFFDYKAYVNIWKADGSALVENFLLNSLSDEEDIYFNTTPVIGDISQDVGLEIIIGEIYVPEGHQFVRAYRVVQGILERVDGWPVDLRQYDENLQEVNSLGLVNLDEDELLEIIVHTRKRKVLGNPLEYLIFAFDGNGDLIENHWPMHFIDDNVQFESVQGVYSFNLNSMAVGDLTGDGDLEFIIPEYLGEERGTIIILNERGELKKQLDIDSYPVGSPLIADINEDPDQEILAVTFSGFLYVWDDQGNLLENFPMNLGAGLGIDNLLPYILRSSAIGDLDRDGDLELVISGLRSIGLFEIGTQSSGMQWSMDRADAQRSGVYYEDREENEIFISNEQCTHGSQGGGSDHLGCGNGSLDIDEQCDDGNRDNGDGCSSMCTIESSSQDQIVQTYSILPQQAEILPDTEYNFDVFYTITPEDKKLSGSSLQLCFDSQMFYLEGCNPDNPFDCPAITNKLPGGDVIFERDIDNFDGDISTDVCVRGLWFHLGFNWPQVEELPIRLFSIRMKSFEQIDPNTNVNFIPAVNLDRDIFLRYNQPFGNADKVFFKVISGQNSSESLLIKTDDNEILCRARVGGCKFSVNKGDDVRLIAIGAVGLEVEEWSFSDPQTVCGRGRECVIETENLLSNGVSIQAYFRWIAGDGNEGNQNNEPVVISNCSELQEMKTTGYYILNSDIDCTSTRSWNEGLGFIPKTFTGVFDGQGYTIKNLYIDASIQQRSDVSVGMFSSILGAEIKHLEIEGMTVNAANGDLINSVGTLAGFIYNSEVHDIHVRASEILNNKQGFIGGLAGLVENSDIDSVSTHVYIEGGDFMGGIAGDMMRWSSLRLSVSEGVIKIEGENTGAIGGLLGRSNFVRGTHPIDLQRISLSSSMAAITAENLIDKIVGGVIGKVDYRQAKYDSTVADKLIFTGQIIDQSENNEHSESIGGLFGASNSIVGTGWPESFWDAEHSGIETNLGSTTGGLTTLQMKTKDTYHQWGDNLEEHFSSPEGRYPVLLWDLNNHPVRKLEGYLIEVNRQTERLQEDFVTAQGVLAQFEQDPLNYVHYLEQIDDISNDVEIISLRSQQANDLAARWIGDIKGFMNNHPQLSQIENLTNAIDLSHSVNMDYKVEINLVRESIIEKVEPLRANGDINENGVVGMVDLIEFDKIIVGEQVCPSTKICDFDNNGILNELDRGMLSGKIASFTREVDFNNDQRLDDEDLLLLNDLLGESECPEGKRCDINGNGQVDADDLSLMQVLLLENFEIVEQDNPQMDVNFNGLLDIRDVYILLMDSIHFDKLAIEDVPENLRVDFESYGMARARIRIEHMLQSKTALGIFKLDVNLDGKVNNFDFVHLYRKLLKMPVVGNNSLPHGVTALRVEEQVEELLEGLTLEDAYAGSDYNDNGVLDDGDVEILTNVVNDDAVNCPVGKNCDIDGSGVIHNIDSTIFSDYVTEYYDLFDLNRSGALEQEDVVILSRVVENAEQCTSDKLCDINRDEKVDHNDIPALRHMFSAAPEEPSEPQYQAIIVTPQSNNWAGMRYPENGQADVLLTDLFKAQFEAGVIRRITVDKKEIYRRGRWRVDGKWTRTKEPNITVGPGQRMAIEFKSGTPEQKILIPLE